MAGGEAFRQPAEEMSGPGAGVQSFQHGHLLGLGTSDERLGVLAEGISIEPVQTLEKPLMVGGRKLRPHNPELTLGAILIL